MARSTQQCVLAGEDTTCVFHRGVPGNPVLVILQEPGVAEKELGRPITGHTGTNLCRLFKMIKNHGCCNKEAIWQFCVRDVTVINALTEAGKVIEKCGKYKKILKELPKKSIVLCFGKEAIRRFKILKKSYFNSCNYLFCFCHPSTRGLSHISVDVKLDGEATEEGKERQILAAMAKFINKHLADTSVGKGQFSLEDFINESGCVWRDKLPDWGSAAYLCNTGKKNLE